MVISNTQRGGESRVILAFARGLSWENSRAGRVRLTLAPQARSDSPGRSPGPMMPWLRPLSCARNAVQFTTTLAGG